MGTVQTIVLSIFIALFTIVGCSNEESNRSDSGSVGIALKPFCSSISEYTSGVNITGQAMFEYREDGNGAIGPARPIRWAEIQVTDPSGNIVQCGATDTNGQFSVRVPAGRAPLVLKINSRSQNEIADAQVLTTPDTNDYYSLSVAFAPEADGNLGTLTASATGDTLGGAFNILDQIHKANLFLKNSTQNCSSMFLGCKEILTPPLVKIYWQKGFNPGTYAGVNAPLSFYLPEFFELYILGGVNGDVTSVDTDHFDNSIILHEYGHFLEDVYSNTDSPGGFHGGNEILDPRLAWGEGWANFFQAAVTGKPIYRDTTGNVDGSPGLNFSEDLETPSLDIPSTEGEGNFREFSISRILWDSIDTTNEGPMIDETTASFAEFWSVFSSADNGFSNANLFFRSIGLFHNLREGFVNSSDWSSLYTGEKHENSAMDFGAELKPGTCTIDIQAANVPGQLPENGSFENSNLHASNDFYIYRHPGGNLNVQLDYTTSLTNPADVDLFLWKDGYEFGILDDLAEFSENELPPGTSNGNESIQGSYPAGAYMLNVHVFTINGLPDLATYTLKINNQTVCP